MEGSCENELSIGRYCDTLARILGERYGVKLICTARPKAGDGEEGLREELPPIILP